MLNCLISINVKSRNLSNLKNIINVKSVWFSYHIYNMNK